MKNTFLTVSSPLFVRPLAQSAGGAAGRHELHFRSRTGDTQRLLCQSLLAIRVVGVLTGLAVAMEPTAPCLGAVELVGLLLLVALGTVLLGDLSH
jgi:hypothetical protein